MDCGQERVISSCWRRWVTQMLHALDNKTKLLTPPPTYIMQFGLASWPWPDAARPPVRMSKHSSTCQEPRDEEHTLQRDTSIRTSQAHIPFRSDPAEREAAVAAVPGAPPPGRRRTSHAPRRPLSKNFLLCSCGGVALGIGAAARPTRLRPAAGVP